MNWMLQRLIEYCTSLIALQSGVTGTGFFVAPGLILTCSHVVKDAYQDKSLNITVKWQQREFSAQISEYSDPLYPDLALLQISETNHPCVYLHRLFPNLETGRRLYSYGYSDLGGDSAHFEYEGPSSERDQSFLKLGHAQVRPGMSGAPLVDEFGRVCGVLKRSRDIDTDLGARAVPSWVILNQFPHVLGQQQKFHASCSDWPDVLDDQQRRLSGHENRRALEKLLNETIPPKEEIHDFDHYVADFEEKLRSSNSSAILITAESGLGKTTLLRRLMYICYDKFLPFSYLNLKEKSFSYNSAAEEIGYDLGIGNLRPRQLPYIFDRLSQINPQTKCIIFIDHFENASPEFIDWITRDLLGLIRPRTDPNQADPGVFHQNAPNLVIVIAGTEKVPEVSDLGWQEHPWKDRIDSIISTSARIKELRVWSEEEIRQFSGALGLPPNNIDACVRFFTRFNSVRNRPIDIVPWIRASLDREEIFFDTLLEMYVGQNR
jgi:hypothetical protein